MGQSNKQKAKAQAGQVFSSSSVGEGTGGGGGVVVLEVVNELVFSLIRLNPDILSQVAEGDWVSVDTSHSLFGVVTKYGLVGRVPERYETKIKENQLFSGMVLEKRISPPGLQVVLRK